MAKSEKVNIGDSILASQYNNLIDDAFGASQLLAHEQATPDLTLKVEKGVYYVGNTRVDFAGGDSPSFTAPTTNPRIDLLVIDSAGVLSRVVGTEAASPTAPAYPADKLVICEVYNRVGQTTIRDVDTAGQGYVYKDVRPFLGGAYIVSDSQVDVNAAIQISKIRKNSDILPETDNLYNLGSPTLQWAEVRAKKLYNDNTEIGGKFGGTGADGALSISSGTTTLDCGAAAVFVKNYTSISITGTAKLAFTNPHANGTIIILKSRGAVTITSSTNPAIDVSGMGALGGSGSSSSGSTNSNGGGGGGGASMVNDGANGNVGSSSLQGNSGNDAYGLGKNTGGYAGGSTAGVSGIGGKKFGLNTGAIVLLKAIALICGSGGGGGAGSNNPNVPPGGNGGRGGGALYIECGDALNFTSNLSCAGLNGTNGGVYQTSNSGNGGGGGGGCILIVYASVTANTGTATVTGGAPGTGGNAAGAGGNGFLAVLPNTDFT